MYQWPVQWIKQNELYFFLKESNSFTSNLTWIANLLNSLIIVGLLSYIPPLCLRSNGPSGFFFSPTLLHIDHLPINDIVECEKHFLGKVRVSPDFAQLLM